MKTKEILETLKKLFSNSNVHGQFLEELRTLLKKDLNGQESDFFNCLTTQLSNIKTFGKMVYTVDSNEKLKGADGHYYSIHLTRQKFNIRFIVNIQDDGVSYFLCAFNEKSGKKVSDYSSYTKVMEKRFQELIKECDLHE